MMNGCADPDTTLTNEWETLEAFTDARGDPSTVRSVASFFVSRGRH